MKFTRHQITLTIGITFSWTQGYLLIVKSIEIKGKVKLMNTNICFLVRHKQNTRKQFKHGLSLTFLHFFPHPQTQGCHVHS